MSGEFTLLLIAIVLVGYIVSAIHKPHINRGNADITRRKNNLDRKSAAESADSSELTHSSIQKVSSENKFRWEELSFLQFHCFEARDIHSYQNFLSINNTLEQDADNETTQSRYLPNIDKTLETVSLDEKVFRWGKLFVKPDAVFYDAEKDEYLVVEYKNREFFNLSSLTPLSVFQLLISAEVVKKHILSRSGLNNYTKKISVRSYMRLNNKVVEITGWNAAIQHVLAMMPNVLNAYAKDSISASELARAFVLFDKVFKFSPQNGDDARFLGQLKHILIRKPAAKSLNQSTQEDKKHTVGQVNENSSVYTVMSQRAPISCHH
jgi:hypothetical protein